MESSTAPTRTDWLSELRIAAWFGVAFGTIAAGMELVRAIGGPVTVDVPADHLSPTSPATSALRPGARLDPSDWLRVRLDDPSPAQAALSLIRDLPTVLFGIAALLMLVRIIATAQRRQTFATEVSRDLRRLGWLTLCGYGLYLALTTFAAAALVDTVSDRGFAVQIDLNYPWILAAFAIFAVSEIVRRGCGIRTELDEVI